VTGAGSLYLDSTVIGTADTIDGSTLYWGDTDGGAEPIVQLGVELDGYNFSKDGIDDGYIDELRFSSNPLEEDDFLTNVPEPSAFAFAMGLFSLLLVGKRRR